MARNFRMPPSPAPGPYSSPDGTSSQWPDLTWPDGRAWLAEYEAYDNVLFIAGPVTLIDALTAIPGVGAERVQ